ncbi:MAG: hypothetical protein JNL89_15120 [Rhodanobacteraceae bacterium]|nr:hypothetical protein [Rhodanobacteraceae bacterium]
MDDPVAAAGHAVESGPAGGFDRSEERKGGEKQQVPEREKSEHALDSQQGAAADYARADLV